MSSVSVHVVQLAHNKKPFSIIHRNHPFVMDFPGCYNECSTKFLIANASTAAEKFCDKIPLFFCTDKKKRRRDCS
jgi:hypothetical protein